MNKIMIILGLMGTSIHAGEIRLPAGGRITIGESTVVCSGNVSDKECIESLTHYCDFYTSLGSGNCFKMLSASQGCGIHGYSKCVQDTHHYCHFHTSLGSNSCFENSLLACKGGTGTLKFMKLLNENFKK